MGETAVSSRSSQGLHADSVDALSETYHAAPINYIQIAPGHLGADIHAASTARVEVREASFETGVLLTIENPFPRFAVAIGLSGRSQLFGNSLTDSNIGYANGYNGIIARVHNTSSWCNISIDHALLQQVAATHDYVIPGGDSSCDMHVNAHNTLVTAISLAARSRRFTELTDAQFEDQIALLVLRVLNPLQKNGNTRLSRHYTIVQCIVDYIHAHYFE